MMELDTDPAPNWSAFLHDITGGDIELQNFLQRCLGYSVTGLTTEDKMFVCVGPEGSGKTTFATTIATLLGDYAWYAPPSALLRPSKQLRGIRFLAVECGKDTKVDTNYLKTLVGGGVLRTEGEEFRSTAKLWLFCQEPPDAFKRDRELVEKVLIIPFLKRRNRTEKLKETAAELRNAGLFQPFLRQTDKYADEAE
jgi:putative DNA primase/helicase